MVDDVRSTLQNEPRDDSGLRLDSILIEEFRYAAQTASQALTDRNRVVEQYLLVVGAAAIGAVGTVYQLSQVGDRGIIPLVLFAFLFGVGLLGIQTFVALIRIRQAFRESLITMTVIKEYYIQHFQQDVPSVVNAFRWRLRGIPAGERAGSITYIYNFTVAFLSAVFFAAASMILYPWLLVNLSGNKDVLAALPEILMGCVVFIITLAWPAAYYRRALSAKSEAKHLDRAERSLDKNQ